MQNSHEPELLDCLNPSVPGSSKAHFVRAKAPPRTFQASRMWVILSLDARFDTSLLLWGATPRDQQTQRPSFAIDRRKSRLPMACCASSKGPRMVRSALAHCCAFADVCEHDGAPLIEVVPE